MAETPFSDPNPRPEHFESPPNAACELFAPISHPDQSLLNSEQKRPKNDKGVGTNGEYNIGVFFSVVHYDKILNLKLHFV